MALPLTEYLEGIESVSPSVMSQTAKSASSSRRYYLGTPQNPVTSGSILIAAAVQILGSTNVNTTGSVRMNRTLPLADPENPTLYATGFSRHGIGQMTKVVNNYGANPNFATALPYFALYPVYQFDVTFGDQPYAVIPDIGIRISKVQWTGVDTSDYQNQQSQTSTIADEWNRFVIFDEIPRDDYVTAVQGQTTLRTGDAFEPPPDIFAPNGYQFPGMPRVLLPNQTLRVLWQNVPLRYYTSANSYLQKYKNRINQLDWNVSGIGRTFAAGSLLYMSCQPKWHTDPNVTLQAWADGQTTPPKVVDMELTFLLTDRAMSGTPITQAQINHPNFIPAGHNLLPWFPHGPAYYYGVAGTAGVLDDILIPYFFSFPVQILFQDPDAPQRGMSNPN